MDGPRGSGKSTLCKELVSVTRMAYYKTWGEGQRTERHKLESLGLNLIQGGFFALDFLTQVKPERSVVIDRSFLSSMTYQMWKDPSACDYYGRLLRKVPAALLVLSAPNDVIYDRRVTRNDEFFSEQVIDEVERRELIDSDVVGYSESCSYLVKHADLTKRFDVVLNDTYVRVYA